MVEQLWKVYGPIVLSALAFFLSFCILQPIAILLGPAYNLLANRGIGKFALMTMALLQLFLFTSTCSKNLQIKFYRATLFFYEQDFFKVLRNYFTCFFFLHVIIIMLFWTTGYALLTPIIVSNILSLILRIFFGLGITLLLAWSEELIFRGVIGNYFCSYFTTLSSVLITSLLFMLVHNLSAPWQLMSTHWRLGLGLFLLGSLLHLIYLYTGKISASMGAHMGLVMVKVMLRRLPCVSYIDQSQWGYIMHSDLRQSGLVHALLLAASMVMYLKVQKDRNLASLNNRNN